jgi:hypothetical protein
MSNVFRAACVQMRSGVDAATNVETATALIREATGLGASFIATPEVTVLFEAESDRLFAKVHVEDEDPSLLALRNTAKELGVWLLIGSMAIKVGERQCANRSFLIGPDGAIRASYDKIHMFDVDLPNGEMYRESRNFRRGERAVVALTPKPIGLVVNNEVMMGGTACNVWVRWGDARDAVDGFPPLWVRGRWDARCPKENVAYVRPLAGMKFAPNVVVPVLPVVPDRAATLAPRGAAMGPGSPATARGVALAASSSPLPPAARDIAALWVEAGGTLKGRVLQTEDRLPQHRSAAQAPKWSSVFAVPIAQVVREINKTSDNLAARSLMLSLSDDDAAPGQSRQSAQRRVRDWLRTQGLVDGDIKVDIGSGQSREERGKPRALVDLLRNAWRTDGAQAFVNSLPIAGVDGTLTNRMRDGAAAGQAFLKTGTLSDTRALAGYVRSRSGKVYAVTAIVNHPDAARARNVLDVFIGWVVKHG